ncbi:MAG: carbonic anhydrase family protein [Proteobacteria bacterium]|nr:carbonic anhydrase family protein [Pseudomonadota bacterium]
MNQALALRAAAFGLVAALLTRTAPAEDSHAHWSYSGATGPAHWAEEDATFTACGPGTDRHQSPINIDSAAKKDLPPIQFDYKPIPLKVTDTGHSFQVNAPPGSGGITIGADHYELVQFHFHEPSEETFHGHHNAMVAHLVHKNAKGELAVVAVQIRTGKENAFLKPVFDDFPAKGSTERDMPGATIDLTTFLPRTHGYYTYEGSLTTPPCSEGVRWLELKLPVEASAAQVQAFAARYSHNARPTQPLNGRTVAESKD